MTGFTIIPEGKIGLVLSKDGKEIPTGRILARKVESDNFQDATSFLNNGGQKDVKRLLLLLDHIV